jgi:hypothetical protein
MTLILLVIAFACFLLAAANTQSKVGLVPLGLAAWVLVHLLPLFHKLGLG